MRVAWSSSCSRNAEGMEPDDLLCSRNARPQKALVGRAQWKINQPPSPEITSELGGIICNLVRRAQWRINQATLEKKVRTGRRRAVETTQSPCPKEVLDCSRL